MTSRLAVLMLLAALCVGCGSTNSRTATEQLLASDAVDAAIAQIDFRPLSGQTVYLDTEYLKNYKGIGFVNADYIISSLRQRIVMADCLLQETKEEADFIIEGRVGALGTDSHDIVYGLPANNILSTAASLTPGAPALPTIPEIALAKKKDELAAAKLAIFAYHRETKRRVWQSGIALARSTAKDTWVLGAGPFQSGSLHDGIQFAGSDIGLKDGVEDDPKRTRLTNFRESAVFNPPAVFQQKPIVAQEQPAENDDGVIPASAEVESSGDSGG